MAITDYHTNYTHSKRVNSKVMDAIFNLLLCEVRNIFPIASARVCALVSTVFGTFEETKM